MVKLTPWNRVNRCITGTSTVLAVTVRRCEISYSRRVEFRRRVKFFLKFCFKNIGKSCCNVKRAYKKSRSSARIVRRNAPSRSDALWRVCGCRVRSDTWCVHMAEAGNRTASDAGCRGRDAVPCVHPHVRRATGATGARTEERPTTKTTARHASGMTTRRMTHERARSSPMRGPDLAQLSRRRTPRTQE